MAVRCQPFSCLRGLQPLSKAQRSIKLNNDNVKVIELPHVAVNRICYSQSSFAFANRQC